MLGDHYLANVIPALQELSFQLATAAADAVQQQAPPGRAAAASQPTQDLIQL